MDKPSQYSFLLESIKVNHNRIYNLPYHQERIRRSLREHLGSNKQIDFTPIIRDIEKLPDMLFKLRMVYNDSFLKYEFIPYQIKPIRSLKRIYTSKVDYPYKYLDRSRLSTLYRRKGKADDILIIKENIVTDTYYCNVALKQGGRWYTPKVPLLKGTKRQQLIDEEIIEEAVISALSISNYSKISLFNAMIEFGDMELAVGDIYSL